MGTDPLAVAGLFGSAKAAALRSGAKAAGPAAGVGRNLAKVGDDFGKLGKMVDNPNIRPSWSITSAHGTERMMQRGVTQDMVNKWMAEGKVLEQTSGNYIYISKEGAAVFSKSGKMITTYSSQYFDENMWNIVRQLFGE